MKNIKFGDKIYKINNTLNNMENQERLSDLYFGHPNASEDEINEAIQASVQKQTEDAMRKIFPMTR